jgi:hypothetical protein
MKRRRIEMMTDMLALLDWKIENLMGKYMNENMSEIYTRDKDIQECMNQAAMRAIEQILRSDFTPPSERI